VCKQENSKIFDGSFCVHRVKQTITSFASYSVQFYLLPPVRIFVIKPFLEMLDPTDPVIFPSSSSIAFDHLTSESKLEIVLAKSCLVCGAVAESKHFGIVSCNACAGKYAFCAPFNVNLKFLQIKCRFFSKLIVNITKTIAILLLNVLIFPYSLIFLQINAV
jgi:hypothetical protein